MQQFQFCLYALLLPPASLLSSTAGQVYFPAAPEGIAAQPAKTRRQGCGYTVTNQINSNQNDTAVRHLAITPPELIEIGLAWRADAAPAVEGFLKFIKPQLPR